MLLLRIYDQIIYQAGNAGLAAVEGDALSAERSARRAIELLAKVTVALGETGMALDLARDLQAVYGQLMNDLGSAAANMDETAIAAVVDRLDSIRDGWATMAGMLQLEADGATDAAALRVLRAA